MAAIFIRLSMAAAEDRSIGFSLFLAASRLTVSAIILLPTWSKIKIKPDEFASSSFYYAIAAGICLAFHFATWISSLAFTSIAASTTIVTTNPIWVGLLSRWWYKEKLSKSVILGIAIALTGAILIGLSDNHLTGINSQPMLGNFLALVGAWMVSLYIMFGSMAQKQGLSLSSYIAIAYSSAALVLLPLPLLFKVNYWGYPGEVYLYICLMAIVSQLIGHTSFNWALRKISPTFITLSILFEPIVASCFGLIIFAEIPPLLVFLGGLIVIVGVAIVVTNPLNKI